MTTDSTQKHHTAAEIEALILSAPSLAKMTCEQLCQERTDDLDTLANLGDFPPKQRGIIRAATLRDLVAINTQIKRQNCPSCS